MVLLPQVNKPTERGPTMPRLTRGEILDTLNQYYVDGRDDMPERDEVENALRVLSWYAAVAETENFDSQVAHLIDDIVELALGMGWVM